MCRFCEVGIGFFSKLESLGSGERVHWRTGRRRSFAISGSTPHYAPDRPFRLEHIAFDIQVDPKARFLEGVVTQRAHTVAPGQSWLKLDQIGLQIQSVTLGQKKVEFVVEGEELRIHLEKSPESGEVFEFSVHYRVENPRRGIYFTGPDADYPHKPYQVWTQGQDEDSRYWFPTLDYPNQKATSEMIVTVPQGFMAVSNGAFISREETAGGTRFHYKLGTPHVTYLTTLVVAEFSEWADQGPRGLPVQYFVTPGREEDGKRAFGNTVKMIEAFEKKIGVNYPYEKYSQVAVQDFIFGGMENTSATTQTDLTLHDARAHLDFSSDPLVSHELAHQWFGDLLTCKDWSHGWLNEGFATFMERIWVELSPAPHGGFEEAKYYSYQDLKEYLADDRKRYRRPIVSNIYIEPIDLFDSHLYQKGGLVLNLIRYVLGEEQFWKSIQLYVKKHQGHNVETLDLIRAIEDVTGRNLRRFFDEWVFHAGYPEFELSYTWHEEKKMTEWVIEQKQTGGAPNVTQDGVTTHLFHLPVTLEMTLENGEKLRHRVDIGESRERIFLPASSKPVMVRFDPDHWIPKTLKFPRPKEMLLYQLKKDPDGMGRIEAAQELAQNPDVEGVRALGEALVSDPFWGVQTEISQVLAGIRMDASRDALIAGLQISNPKARRAVISALSTFRDEKVALALRQYAEKDESYFVEADAIYSWANSQFQPLHFSKNERYQKIEEFLIQQLSKSSYREVIRASALASLAEIPGIGRGERPRALDVLMDWTRRGKSMDARGAAIRALGKVLKTASVPQKARILEVFYQLGDEDHFRLRMQLIASLEESGCAEGIPLLEQIHQLDSAGRVKRTARNAIDTLTLAGSVPESVTNLKAELEKLEENYRKLRTWVEERHL